MGANRKKQIGHRTEMAHLEISCKDCDGKGMIPDHITPNACPACGGSGFSRSELGQRVLDLVRHNFRILLREAIGDA
jgi:DnaJ-class molecular chaperone